MKLCTNVPERVYDAADSHRGVWGTDDEIELLSADQLQGAGSDENRLDAVAAVSYAFVRLSIEDDEYIEDGWRNSEAPSYDTGAFVDTLNDILLNARVDWHFVDNRFVQRGNSVLHAEVVKPATILLSDLPVFTAASRGFNAAISRLSEGKPDVAITDAASAVQEFFRALGVDGNSLADQINVAERKKLITKFDRHLLKPFTDWLNSDRSEHGNAHGHREGDVTKADAWLAIHVAGALMIRLSNREPRDIVAARELRESEAAEFEAERLRLARVAQPDSVSGPWGQSNEPWATTGSYSDETPF